MHRVSALRKDYGLSDEGALRVLELAQAQQLLDSKVRDGDVRDEQLAGFGAFADEADW